MFRLPTHLESLVPPPTDQVPQSHPWRGSIILPATSPHPSSRPREIRVTAAETENDNQQELWPEQLQLQLIRRRGVLREVHDWLAQIQTVSTGLYPPRCMLMPDRLAEHLASEDNQAMFEAFARQLLEEDIVAIAQWSASEVSAHSGILLYPTTSTRALLVGIVFLNQGFPEFIHGSLSHSSTGPSGSSRSSPGHAVTGQAGHSYTGLTSIPRVHPFQPVTHHSPYDPAPPNIASSVRYTPSGFEASEGRSGRSSG